MSVGDGVGSLVHFVPVERRRSHWWDWHGEEVRSKR
jgi:hypothetical protein